MTSTERQALWSGHVAEFKSSGLSQRVFCEQRGLKVSTLGYWSRRFGGKEGVRRPRFAKVAISDSRGGQAILCLPYGLEVRTSALPDPQWIAALVREIGERS